MSALTPEEREALFRTLLLLAREGLADDWSILATLRDRLEKAEPVAKKSDAWGRGQVVWFESVPDDTKLYAAPPAPAAVPDAKRILPVITGTCDEHKAQQYARGWNACRAEMLRLAAAPRNEQGGE